MNKDLNIRFENILKKIGFANDIEHPVFYNSEFGLRFEIGHGDVYIKNNKGNIISANPMYVSECLERAEKLFLAVEPDILRVDVYPNENYYSGTRDFLIRTLGSPEDFVKDENVHQLYWNIIDINKCIPILKEIILSDIGGKYVLNTCVYFANSNTNIMYHLYDDRGADIAADNKKILMPIYQKFNNWILEYDRERIEKNLYKYHVSLI